MKTELTKHTVFAYFSGDTTALQKQMIEEWLKSKENVELYFEWLEEWERLNPQFQPDVNRALDLIETKVTNEEVSNDTDTIEGSRGFFAQQGLIWAAASIIMLGFAAFLGKDLVMYRTYEAQYGQLNHFTLDDSSGVVLNSNSTLKVPRWGFGKSTRHVYLDGEAEFSVKHTIDHQLFKVHTNDENLITVLGTEFVVYTRQQQTNVVLNNGKVELSSAAGESKITMRPGDRATVDRDGEITVEQLTPKQLVENAVWKEHRFVFDDTPLKEVALKIREVFGVEVTINNQILASRTATGSFPAKNANELLTSMSYMYSFEIATTNSKIVLIPNP